MKPLRIALCLSVCAATCVGGAPVDFGAYYTEVKAGRDWEEYARTGKDADVVVRLAKAGGELVFWRGVSYIPMLVNESNPWFTQEFNETGFTATAPGDCEPMSDKAYWDSHARIIENTGKSGIRNSKAKATGACR